MAEVRTPQQIVSDEAGRLELEPALALALIEQESGFNPQAKSPTGVQGLAQVTNATGAAYGQTPQTRTDPGVSARAGLSYFKDLLTQEGGNIPGALTRYNGGSDPNFAQNVLARYPKHATAQAATDYQRLMGTSEAAPDGKADYERLMGTSQPTPDGRADYERLMGRPASAPGPADTGPLPTVRPNPNPTQPATLEYPGSSPATRATDPALPPSDFTLNIEKASSQDAPSARFTGMNDVQLMQAFGYDPFLLTTAKGYRPGMFEAMVHHPGVQAGTLGGVVEGLKRPFLALTQGVTHALGTPADAALEDLKVKLNEAIYQETPNRTTDVPLLGKTDLPALTGTMLVPLPGTRGVLPAGTSAAGRIGSGTANAALTGTVAGGAQPVNEPGPPGTANDTYWQQKLEQGQTGALVGGGTGALTSTVGAVGTKAVNAARNLSPRYAQVEEALTAATGADGRVNERIFNAVLNSTPGAKFAGQEKWEVDGLQKLVAHIQQAPARLDRARDALTTMSIVAHGPLAPLQSLVGPGFTIVKLAKMLYSTPQGRNFLLAASDLQPGSGAMSRLVARIGSELPRVLATETTQPDAPVAAP